MHVSCLTTQHGSRYTPTTGTRHPKGFARHTAVIRFFPGGRSFSPPVFRGFEYNSIIRRTHAVCTTAAVLLRRNARGRIKLENQGQLKRARKANRKAYSTDVKIHVFSPRRCLPFVPPGSPSSSGSGACKRKKHEQSRGTGTRYRCIPRGICRSQPPITRS